MVGRFGEVFVMDWGLAQSTVPNGLPDTPSRVQTVSDEDGDSGARSGSQTLDGTVVGSPAYRGPLSRPRAASMPSAWGPTSLDGTDPL